MTEGAKERRALDVLFRPASLAVVGASDDPRKWGNWLAARALRGEHRRRVYLVNRRGGTVLGRPAFPSLLDLPETPELAVVTVPAREFEGVVDTALAAGVRGIVGISAGLGEMGLEQRAREQALVERVRAAGAVLLGPNSLGLCDTTTDLYLASNDLPPGRIGLISQSGNLALEIGERASRVGLGVRRFVSVGNQADLDVADVLEAFAATDDMDAVAIYCEDFHDGRRLATIAHRVARAGCPVVLIAPGGSPAGSRAAASHTGALTSDLAVVDAACAAAGIYRVSTPREMVDLLQGMIGRRPYRGRRVAVLADGGGHGAIAADTLSRYGLDVPRLSDELAATLAARLPPTASTRNPVDMAGAGEQGPASFVASAEVLLGSPEVDLLLMTGYFGGYALYSDELGRAEARAAAALADVTENTGKQIVVQTMYPNAAASHILREWGVPVYDAVEDAARVIDQLSRQSSCRAPGVPALPPPARPVGETGYWSARRLIASAGIAVPDGRLADSAAEVLEAARALGFPVVLKATGLQHKSDAGGVALGVADEATLKRAYRDMIDRLGPQPVSVEQMVDTTDGVELLVGVRRDARFGPAVLVGMGGIFAEIMRDVAVSLAPVDERWAEGMLRSLRGAPLLFGARGRESVDVSAAVAAVAVLSALAAAHPELEALEINPLLVCPHGAVALDARVVI